MMTDCLTDRLGSKANLPVRQSGSIGTMLNCDGDGDGDGDGTCKQTFNIFEMAK